MGHRAPTCLLCKVPVADEAFYMKLNRNCPQKTAKCRTLKDSERLIFGVLEAVKLLWKSLRNNLFCVLDILIKVDQIIFQNFDLLIICYVSFGHFYLITRSMWSLAVVEPGQSEREAQAADPCSSALGCTGVQ